MTTFSRTITAVLASSSLGASTVAGATGETMDLGTKVAADPSSRPHIQSARNVMTESVSRSELNAEVRVLKAEAEVARAGLDAKIERVLDAIVSASAKTDSTILALAEKVSDVREDNKNTRNITLVAVVGAALAALAAIYGAQSNNIAAMQVGIEAARDAMAPRPDLSAAAPAAPAVPAKAEDGT